MGLLAVLDIGKSNARLTVIDPATELPLYTARRSNRGIETADLRQLDIAGLEGWLLDSLAACPERARIGCIVPVAHGAACVMLDREGEIVAAPDYEDPIFEADHDAYARLRDDFTETLSPDLPLGLNFGRQIFAIEQHLPDQYRRIDRILTYPQYWAWLLCGVAASEVTSLGCHTDLWSPAHADFSPLAQSRGWAGKFPALRAAADELGSIRPALAARYGLDPDCRVLCGIHDSNASYLRHRMHRTDGAPFSVISSGTWTVILASGADLSCLCQDRDMLANVDAFGGVVGTARFMGGWEYEAVAGPDAATPDLAALSRVLSGPALVEPGFTAGGQFPNHAGAIHGANDLGPPARAALATLYIALLSDNALDLLGASGDIVIDGPLGENALYPSILAALRPNSRIQLGEPGAGTAGGALCLALGMQSRPPALHVVEAGDQILDLAAHKRRWTERIRGIVA
jgi:sugar (pentulose or hexulose) kinase